MRTLFKKLLGLSLAAFLAIGGCIVGISSLNAAPTGSDAPSALKDWSGCLLSGKEGDLLLLVDKSGSLRETDPLNVRVAAMSYLLRQLASSSAGKYDLNVAVATFSVDFGMVLPWETLDSSTLPTFQSAIDGLKTENNGVETDYWTALEGARRVLAERAQSGHHCQAIAWFSDGRLDLEPKANSGVASKPFAEGNPLANQADVEAAEDAAREALCRDQGLADALRAADVKIFGFGLLRPDGSNVDDFTFMKGVAIGDRCGALTSPTPGAFWLAEDVDDVIFNFTELTNPEIPTKTEPVCQGQICVEGRHSVVLDNSVNAVTILGTAPVDGLKVYLIDPSSKQTSISLGNLGAVQSASLESGELAWTWLTQRTVSIQLDKTGGGWSGEWIVVFVDPTASSQGSMSRTQIRVSGGLTPIWTPKTTNPIHLGDSLRGTHVGLLDAQNTPVDPNDLLGDATLLVELIDSSRTSHLVDSLDKNEISSPLDVDLSGLPQGRVALRLTLHITTAAIKDAQGTVKIPGTALNPSVSEFSIDILPPPDIPVVPDTVNFGIVDDHDKLSATANMAVTGQGCVWLDPTSMSLSASPAGVKEISVTSEAVSGDTCVKGPLPLTLSLDSLDNGALSGTISVWTAPVDEIDRAIVQKVKFTADVRKPIKTSVLWGTFALCLALGLLIPLGLLWVFKAVSARVPESLVAAKSFDIRVDSGQVTSAGKLLSLTTLETEQVALGGGRDFSAAGVNLRTVVGISPFGTANVVTDAPGLYCASKSHHSSVGKDHHAVLPLAIQDNWILKVDPELPEGQATLVFLVSGYADDEALKTLVEDATTHVPDIYTSLRALISKDRGKDEGNEHPDSDDWGSSSSSSSGDEWESSESSSGGTNGW